MRNNNMVESLNAQKAVLLDWIRCDFDIERLKTFFESHNYKGVAIYGMGALGYLLRESMLKCGIKPRIYIDQDLNNEKKGVIIITPSQLALHTEYIDVVVVCAIYYFDEIFDNLRPLLRKDIDIIGIDEIILDGTDY